MTFDKPGDPHARDTTLARLLAEAFESQSKLAGQPKDSACPDAELLAAYAEQGLAKEEAARWESHFADCSRCQKIIAVLAASGEELTEAEIKKFGSLVATTSARQPAAGATAATISRRPTLVRWLAPVIGVAAAVVVWFALRPVLRREAQDSQRIAATTGISQGTGQATPAAPAAKQDETQMAQANVPPPPAPASEALRRDAAPARANLPGGSPAAGRKETFQGQVQSAPPDAQLDRAAPASEATGVAIEKDKQAAPAQAAEQKSQSVGVFGGAPAGAPGSARAPAREEARALDGSVASSARNQASALAKIAAPPVVFGSPDRGALWRLGPGGRIEHSNDRGQTWQPQSSGVTADLVAGAAPSEKTAWIAGRGGIILRTQDGDHWQQVTPPPFAQTSPPPDWIGIEAHDALRATIISRDLRRFATEDGGRTWVQQ
jgi:hypothetical protein